MPPTTFPWASTPGLELWPVSIRWLINFGQLMDGRPRCFSRKYGTCPFFTRSRKFVFNRITRARSSDRGGLSRSSGNDSVKFVNLFICWREFLHHCMRNGRPLAVNKSNCSPQSSWPASDVCVYTRDSSSEKILVSKMAGVYLHYYQTFNRQ